MKKISVGLFFTVLWRGLCQAVEWFFGLFGRKKNGLYAKFIWGLFATSAAFVMAVIAIVFVTELGMAIYEKYYKEAHCYDPDCYHSEFISENVYFHNLDDGKGYIFNSLTEEKLIRNVKWIAKPEGKDSLICFCDGKKRGYFSKNTGKVVIEPKYGHAWVFSEGLASVEEGGRIKFIDGTDKVVIDLGFAYVPNMEGFAFHGGYCVVKADDDELYGLMDKAGRMVLPQEYSFIAKADNSQLWRIRKGNEASVLNKDLNPVLPMADCQLFIGDGTIDMTLPDHTMHKYDLQGKLINDFYINGYRMLEYEKDEISYGSAVSKEYDDEGKAKETTDIEPYHPKATARLRAYVAGDGYEGLMTADGHVVTMPLYRNINAIGYDLYLCTSTNSDEVIVNGKGEMVR